MKTCIGTFTDISVTICFWAAAAHCYALFVHPVNPDTWYSHIACGGDVDNSSSLWTWDTCKTNSISCVEPDLSWGAPQPIGTTTSITRCPLDLSISIEEDHKWLLSICDQYTLESVGLNTERHVKLRYSTHTEFTIGLIHSTQECIRMGGLSKSV